MRGKDMEDINKNINDIIDDRSLSEYFNLGWDSNSNLYQLDEKIRNKYKNTIIQMKFLQK